MRPLRGGRTGENNGIRSRTGSATLCLCAMGLLVLPAVASGLPTVTFKAKAAPIAGFPHTGNIRGAGAAIQTEFAISGTEYGGYPPPLVGVNVSLPTGTKLQTAGFPACGRTVLEHTGPSACPKSSAAGPTGKVLGIVSFGSERVEERATLESFFASGAGLEFFTDGHSPVTLEILSHAHYARLGGGGGFGPEILTEIPLVSTVPDAPYASVESISEMLGTAHKVHGKPVYYATVPKKCTGGGLAYKAELIFDEGGANPIVPQTVTTTYKAPCPRA